MGSYLNPGNFSFRGSLRSKIYVDKSELIAKTNEVLCTEQRYICVSRPRRFGKSMAANMLAAYYDRSENTEELFQNLAICEDKSYKENLNQYDVIKVNMQEFLSMSGTMEEMLKNYLVADFEETYPEVRFRDEKNLIQVMKDVFSYTRCPFVILIDEWDCLFREYKQDKDAQKKYLDFLRAWLKDKDYVAMAYMTGILPIKKYGSHSALNMFTEYSMTDPGELAEYFGFTEQEVAALCEKYEMSFEEAKTWYDGYQLIAHRQAGDEIYSMYSPKSVVEAMLRHKFGTYWNQTETYEALKIYIQMDMDGLKDSVVRMPAGEAVSIHIGTFSNDMTTFATKDDVLTLLVHLGYLTYNSIDETVSIPNKEVSQEYVNAISTMNWHGVADSVESSRKLLELYKPDVNDLWFRKRMMSDEQTMSYNHASGGTIAFPEECWTDWYDRWITNSNGQRFYRYVKENNSYIGETAYYFDAERQIYIADVVIYAPYRGKGYGREGLLLLCEAAKENGVKELYDDIAIDNSSVSLFLKCGFTEVRRTSEYILVKKELF